MIDITLRALKGAPLSIAEQDGNLIALRDAIAGLEGGIFITSWEQDENLALTFRYSDGSIVGPIVLPTKPVRIRDEWSSGIVYFTGDVIPRVGSSFIAAKDHQAGVFADDLLFGNIRLLAAAGAAVGIGDAPVDTKSYVRTNGAWTAFPPFPASVEEAPGDEKRYVRRRSNDVEDGQWVELPEIVPDAPDDGTLYARKDGEWIPVPETSSGGGGMLRWRGPWGGPQNVSDGLGQIKMFDVVSRNGTWWVAMRDNGDPDVPGDTIVSPRLPGAADDPNFEFPGYWGMLTFPILEAPASTFAMRHANAETGVTRTVGEVLDELLTKVAALEAA